MKEHLRGVEQPLADGEAECRFLLMVSIDIAVVRRRRQSVEGYEAHGSMAARGALRRGDGWGTATRGGVGRWLGASVLAVAGWAEQGDQTCFSQKSGRR